MAGASSAENQQQMYKQANPNTGVAVPDFPFTKRSYYAQKRMNNDTQYLLSQSQRKLPAGNTFTATRILPAGRPALQAKKTSSILLSSHASGQEQNIDAAMAEKNG